MDVSDEVLYYKITSMISHETAEGASLLKKIDKAFDGNEDPHKLWIS